MTDATSNAVPESVAEERRWLDDYVATGSHEAFGKLVARHVDLVYSAALRQTRGDRHMAEDVAQAAFLVLATKAAGVRREASLASWLVVVTRYAARDALKAEARRKRREQAVAQVAANQMTPMNSTPHPSAEDDDAEWQAIAPELDAALASLGDKDRRAVVLRYLQGHSIEEVAAITGATPNAAKQRLHRAVERMRSFFRARGVSGVTTAALGPVLLRHAIAPAPAGLAKGLAAAVTSTAGASASGVALAKGVVVAMSWTKVKVAAVTAAALLCVGGGTAVAVNALRKPAADTVVISPNQPSNSGKSLVEHVAVVVSDGDWRTTFYKAYGLKPGEVVRFVPKPFPAERALYVQDAKLPASSAQALMTFRWDGALHWTSSSYGDEGARIAVEYGAGLAWYDYDDPDHLIATPMPGDWVFRAGAQRQEVLNAIGDLLATRVGAPVRFEKQQIKRDVIVVTGSFDPRRIAALPGGAIALGDRPDNEPGSPNRDTLKAVLNHLAQAVNLRVIDRSTGSGATVAWRHYGPQPKDADRVVASVAEQTGLEFRRESRDADVWRVSVDPAWRQRFDAVYGLSPGESLKRVPRPFIPERATFWAGEARRFGNPAEQVPLTPDSSVAIEYDASNAPHWTSIFGDRTTRRVLFGVLNGVKPWDVEVAPAVLDVPLPGDWVARQGVTVEEQLADFSRVLSAALNRPVHFERRRVSREVIVARGTYRFAPLQGNPAAPAVIDLYDADPPADLRTVVQESTLGHLLDRLQGSVDRRVIDETNSASTRVTWKDRRYNKDPNVLLANVAKQTGLRFDRETRDVDAWVLVNDADGSRFTGPVPSAAATRPDAR